MTGTGHGMAPPTALQIDRAPGDVPLVGFEGAKPLAGSGTAPRRRHESRDCPKAASLV